MARFDFYNTKKWQKIRLYVINRAGGLCEECNGTVCDGKATIAHHKIIVTPENVNDPYVVWNADNIMAVSQDCHNRIHHSVSDNSACMPGLGFDSEGNLVLIEDVKLIG